MRVMLTSRRLQVFFLLVNLYSVHLQMVDGVLFMLIVIYNVSGIRAHYQE